MAKKSTAPPIRVRRKLPSYRRHSTRNIGFCEWQGTRHYFPGEHGSPESLEAFSRFLAEHVLRPTAALPRVSATAPTTNAAPSTVLDVSTAYWLHAKTHYRKNGKPTKHLGNLKPMISLLNRLYGSTPAAEFGPLALKALRAVLVKQDRSRKYINAIVRRIVLLFRWGVSEELVPAATWEALRSVEGLKKGRSEARETTPVEPARDEDVDAVLPHLPAVVADMVRIQRLTGARPGEVCALRPRDLDRSGPVWLYRPPTHKTEHHDKERIVPVGPRGQEILTRYLDRPADAHCFSPAESEQKRLLVLHAARKTPLSCGNRPGSKKKKRPKAPPRTSYDKNTYAQALSRGCQRAWPAPAVLRAKIADLQRLKKSKVITDEQVVELKRLVKARDKWRPPKAWAPNQLRHSAATEIRERFGLEAVQATLGHANLKTSEIYAERILALAVRVAAEMG